jgi:hypothetical protein
MHFTVPWQLSMYQPVVTTSGGWVLEFARTVDSAVLENCEARIVYISYEGALLFTKALNLLSFSQQSIPEDPYSILTFLTSISLSTSLVIILLLKTAPIETSLLHTAPRRLFCCLSVNAQGH